MSGPGWSSAAFADLGRLLEERSGLSFEPLRCESVETGASRAMARAGIDDEAEYLAALRAERAPLDDLIAEVTIGETYFFRDPAQFEFLRREVLPDRARGGGAPIRLWSAGCASGEEAYSLAILLEQEGLVERAGVLATDVSRRSLAAARRASYTAWSLRGVDPALVERHFRRDGAMWVLDERIRRRVGFEYLNLALDAYPSLANGLWGLDVILCRNVLIYFGRRAVAHVARRLYDSLAEGGWLIAGASDPPLAEEAPFEVVVARDGVFYRRGKRPIACAFQTLQPVAVAALEAPESELARPDPLREANPAPTASVVRDVLSEARSALDRGEWEAALRLAAEAGEVEAADALRVRATANLRGPAEAASAAVRACVRHPLSAELRFLAGVLLWTLGRDGEAQRELRRALYLDRSLAVAHFVLGAVLARIGDAEGARRAYRNAQRIAEGMPAGAPVPLADGEPAGRLAEAARAAIALLDAPVEANA